MGRLGPWFGPGPVRSPERNVEVFLPHPEGAPGGEEEVPLDSARGKEFMRLLGPMLHEGYEVEFARDGREAIEKYIEAKQSNKPFDVVIMDLTIPGSMGGREAIKRLIEIDPNVKAIVSSGYSNDPVMAEYTKYGFRDVIAKPYKIEELSKILAKVINEDKKHEQKNLSKSL